MKATLDVIKQRGIFFTTWTVECRFQFTEAERAAIRQGKLYEKPAYYVGIGENHRAVTLGQIAGGIRHTFPTLLEAREHRRFIEETILPKIGSWVESRLPGPVPRRSSGEQDLPI